MTVPVFCAWFEAQLPGFEAGDLSEWRTTLVAGHLAGCPGCRRRFNQQVELASGLRGKEYRRCEFAPVWSRMESELIRESRPAFVPRYGRSVGVAGCAAAVLAATFGVLRTAPQGHRVSVATPVSAVSTPLDSKSNGVSVRSRVSAMVRSAPPVEAREEVLDPFERRVATQGKPSAGPDLPKVVRADLRSMIQESDALREPSYPVELPEGPVLSEPVAVGSTVSGSGTSVVRTEFVPGDLPIDSTDRSSRAYDAPGEVALRTVAVRDLFR